MIFIQLLWTCNLFWIFNIKTAYENRHRSVKQLKLDFIPIQQLLRFVCEQVFLSLSCFAKWLISISSYTCFHSDMREIQFNESIKKKLWVVILLAKDYEYENVSMMMRWIFTAWPSFKAFVSNETSPLYFFFSSLICHKAADMATVGRRTRQRCRAHSLPQKGPLSSANADSGQHDRESDRINFKLK